VTALAKALIVARRELAAYFFSPVSYLVATMFLLVQGYSFWLFLSILNARPVQHGAVMQYFFGGTVLFWLFVMFLAAVITMRLIAEERRSGTLEPLVTAPIGEPSIIVGKYLGSVGFYAALWLPTLVYVVILRAYSPEGAAPDPGPVAAGYLGTLLVSSSALALGLLFSTLTRNQILAAVASFVTLAMLLLLGPLGRMVSWAPAAAVFRYIDLFGTMEELGRGIVDSRRFVYHLSIVAVALFAATRALAAGRATSLKRRALVEIALAALIAVGLNVLGARHYARGDWTRGRTFALSDKTTELVRGLRRDVDIIVFMLPTGQEANDLYGDVHELCERLRRLSPHLHVEYVDIDREPERLKTVGKKYGVSGDDLVDGVIVVAAGDQSKFVTRAELADYDYAAATEGRPPPMKAWKGEQALDSALYAVTDERAPAVCFVGGHGEPAIDGFDPDAYGDLAEELRRDHQAPRAITLDRGVPADCDVAVVAGPDRPLPKPDAVELDRFLERGGRLFALLGPSFDSKVTRFVDVGIEDLLDRWGASPRNDVVVDEPRLRGSAVAFAVTEGYADHPITQRLLHHQTLWSNVREIRATPKLGVVARELVHTSEAGWGETNLGIFRAEAELQYDAGQDVKGPVPIAVASERTEGTGKGARLVVFGSSELASNRVLLAGYNRDLVLAALAWLEHRAPRIAIGPRPTEHLRLTLDDRQLERVLGLCVGALPLLVLLIGAGVFWVRRS
jgi:ABC-type transport system involved in multi-copper enzyme maturation permease subunit